MQIKDIRNYTTLVTSIATVVGSAEQFAKKHAHSLIRVIELLGHFIVNELLAIEFDTSERQVPLTQCACASYNHEPMCRSIEDNDLSCAHLP
eukprot:2122457-Amphidinium_carterae.1